jgi:cation-dependent mannose-6-phosphate receptor
MNTALLVLICGVCAVMASMPNASPVSEIRHLIPEVDKPSQSFSIANAAEIATAPIVTLAADVVPALGATQQPNAINCKYAAPSPGTATWDLSSLTKTDGSDYTGTDTEYKYKMNVCGVSTGCDGGATPSKNLAICQFSMADVFVASLGSFAVDPVWALIGSPPLPAEKGVQYTMTNGEQCWIEGRQMIRTVNQVFSCRTGSGTDSTVTVTEDKIQCIFTVTLNTDKACQGSGPGPTPDPPKPSQPSSGLGGGSVFIIIVFSLIPVYIGLGCLYGYKKKGVAGIEAFPNIEFWRDLPALVRDGARYSWNMTRSGCKNGRAEQYDAL